MALLEIDRRVFVTRAVAAGAVFLAPGLAPSSSAGAAAAGPATAVPAWREWEELLSSPGGRVRVVSDAAGCQAYWTIDGDAYAARLFAVAEPGGVLYFTAFFARPGFQQGGLLDRVFRLADWAVANGFKAAAASPGSPFLRDALIRRGFTPAPDNSTLVYALAS